MTGKTHVAIGIAVAMTGQWIDPTNITNSFHSLLVPDQLIQPLLGLGAVCIGSLLPDLDQPGSTLSRQVGGPFGTSKIMALIGSLGAFFLGTHLPSLLVHVPYLSIGLFAMGSMLLMMALLHHRGITHSLAGMLLVGYIAHELTSLLIIQGLLYASSLLIPFLVGYVAHLVADAFTNSGIAPFYLPFFPSTHTRWHFPINIRTGSFWDRVLVRWSALGVVILNFVN